MTSYFPVQVLGRRTSHYSKLPLRSPRIQRPLVLLRRTVQALLRLFLLFFCSWNFIVLHTFLQCLCQVSLVLLFFLAISVSIVSAIPFYDYVLICGLTNTDHNVHLLTSQTIHNAISAIAAAATTTQLVSSPSRSSTAAKTHLHLTRLPYGLDHFTLSVLHLAFQSLDSSSSLLFSLSFILISPFLSVDHCSFSNYFLSVY